MNVPSANVNRISVLLVTSYVRACGNALPPIWPSGVNVRSKAFRAGCQVPLPSPGSAKVSTNFQVPAREVLPTVCVSDLLQENNTPEQSSKKRRSFFICRLFNVDKKNS